MSKADLHVKLAGGQQIVGGYSIQAFQNGPISGSFTPNPLNGNYQTANIVGATQINAPSVDCAIDFLVNIQSVSGTITFSGYTVNSNTGEPLTTTVGHIFIISIRRIVGLSTYVIKALQ